MFPPVLSLTSQLDSYHVKLNYLLLCRHLQYLYYVHFKSSSRRS